MATEFKLSYTALEIDEKLGKINSLAEKSELPTKTSDLTNDSGFTTESYVDDKISGIKISGGVVFQPEAPEDKTALWIDTDDDTVDGISPIANIRQTEDGAIITITDKNGTTSATITNGKNGDNGVGFVSVSIQEVVN